MFRKLLKAALVLFLLFGGLGVNIARADFPNWETALTGGQFTNASAGWVGQGVRVVADLTTQRVYKCTGSPTICVASNLARRVNEIAYDENGGRLLAATIGAGVYQSVDLGATWTDANLGGPAAANIAQDILPLESGLLVANMTDDQVQYYNGAIWSVALVVDNPRSLREVAGKIYLAADGGMYFADVADPTTWTQIPATGRTWSQTYDIHPWGTSSIYVATEDGIFFLNDLSSGSFIQQNSFFSFYFARLDEALVVGTQTEGVLAYSTVSGTWEEYGIGLGLDRVNKVMTGDNLDAYAFGVTNPTTTYAVWRIALPNPSAVELVRFEAEIVNGVGVQLEWETAMELDHAGFNLYANEMGTPPVKLNPTLIPPQNPGSVMGASYIFTHTTGSSVLPLVGGRTYEWKLESLDVHGISTRHRPSSLTFPAYRVYLPLILK